MSVHSYSSYVITDESAFCSWDVVNSSSDSIPSIFLTTLVGDFTGYNANELKRLKRAELKTDEDLAVQITSHASDEQAENRDQFDMGCNMENIKEIGSGIYIFSTLDVLVRGLNGDVQIPFKLYDKMPGSNYRSILIISNRSEYGVAYKLLTDNAAFTRAVPNSGILKPQQLQIVYLYLKTVQNAVKATEKLAGAGDNIPNPLESTFKLKLVELEKESDADSSVWQRRDLKQHTSPRFKSVYCQLGDSKSLELPSKTGSEQLREHCLDQAKCAEEAKMENYCEQVKEVQEKNSENNEENEQEQNETQLYEELETDAEEEYYVGKIIQEELKRPKPFFRRAWSGFKKGMRRLVSQKMTSLE